MDQKHDTHLFVEVNQAINVWSIRQDWLSGSRLLYATQNGCFWTTEVFDVIKLDLYRNIFQFTGMILALQIVSNRSAITIILGAEKLTSAFYHFQKPNGENLNHKKVFIQNAPNIFKSWHEIF